MRERALLMLWEGIKESQQQRQQQRANTEKPMGYMTNGLTFNALREANSARLKEHKNARGQPVHLNADGTPWTPAQWLQALTGELGEYANVRKKFERGDIDKTAFQRRAAGELADAVTYLDFLAWSIGVDLGQATIAKFNRVSERRRLTVYLREDGSDWQRRPVAAQAPEPNDPTERVARLMFANSRETAWADLSEDDKELWRDGARINIALNPGYYAALVAWMGRALEVPAMPADEPHACDCSVCGRKSWSGSDMGQPCGMAQPDGTVCPGTMR